MFNPAPECRHILASGRKCHALALKGESFCYYHCRSGKNVETNRLRKHSVALPLLEDNASVLISLNALFAGYAASKINRRTLGTYLYGLSLADKILLRDPEISRPDPSLPRNNPTDNPPPSASGEESKS